MDTEEDRWQKGFREEAKEIIKRNQEDYNATIRMSNVVAAKMCEQGIHQTEDKLFFCKRCTKSFCKGHGYSEKKLCSDCLEGSF